MTGYTAVNKRGGKHPTVDTIRMEYRRLSMFKSEQFFFIHINFPTHFGRREAYSGKTLCEMENCYWLLILCSWHSFPNRYIQITVKPGYNDNGL